MALALAVATLVAAVGCGGGDSNASATTAADTTPSVASTSGAALTDRVLAADEFGIPGFVGSNEPVVSQDPKDFLDGNCAEANAETLAAITASGAQAAARRGFEGNNSGGLSAVWQFSTPAGAAIWNKVALAQSAKTYEACLPKGVKRTGYNVQAVAGLPRGYVAHFTESTPDGAGEGYNVIFTDGSFAYQVGASGLAGQIKAAWVIDAARRQWARRNG